jgi:hypothetical protein
MRPRRGPFDSLPFAPTAGSAQQVRACSSSSSGVMGRSTHDPSPSPACKHKKRVSHKYKFAAPAPLTLLTGRQGSSLWRRMPVAPTYPAGGGGLQFLGGYSLGAASHVASTRAASGPASIWKTSGENMDQNPIFNHFKHTNDALCVHKFGFLGDVGMAGHRRRQCSAHLACLPVVPLHNILYIVMPC